MSRKAARLFERMKEKQAGWHPHHFHTLYLGYGFTMTEGKSHTVFIHPEFTQLRDVIPRHPGELGKGYAREAVKNIESLLRLKKERRESDE